MCLANATQVVEHVLQIERSGRSLEVGLSRVLGAPSAEGCGVQGMALAVSKSVRSSLAST